MPKKKITPKAMLRFGARVTPLQKKKLEAIQKKLGLGSIADANRVAIDSFELK